MPETISIAFEPKQLDYLVTLLRRSPLPWDDTNPLIVSITQQVKALQEPREPPVPHELPPGVERIHSPNGGMPGMPGD